MNFPAILLTVQAIFMLTFWLPMVFFTDSYAVSARYDLDGLSKQEQRLALSMIQLVGIVCGIGISLIGCALQRGDVEAAVAARTQANLCVGFSAAHFFGFVATLLSWSSCLEVGLESSFLYVMLVISAVLCLVNGLAVTQCKFELASFSQPLYMCPLPFLVWFLVTLISACLFFDQSLNSYGLKFSEHGHALMVVIYRTSFSSQLATCLALLVAGLASGDPGYMFRVCRAIGIGAVALCYTGAVNRLWWKSEGGMPNAFFTLSSINVFVTLILAFVSMYPVMTMDARVHEILKSELAKQSYTSCEVKAGTDSIIA